MPKTREQQLLDIGLAKLSPEQQLVMTPMIRAMAAMLAEATKTPAKKVKDPETSVYFAEGRELHRRLMGYAPDAVAWEPVQARTLVVLGRESRDIPPDHLGRLGVYLAAGGLAWMREKPATSYIAKNLQDLVAKARAWAGAAQASALDRVRER